MNGIVFMLSFIVLRFDFFERREGGRKGRGGLQI